MMAKRLAMADLRALLLGLGYDTPKTLLNSGNAVFEADKSNNTGASGAIPVSLAPADLVVQAVSAPSAALPGSAVLVRWTVANQSTGDTAVSSWRAITRRSSTGRRPARPGR